MPVGFGSGSVTTTTLRLGLGSDRNMMPMPHCSPGCEESAMIFMACFLVLKEYKVLEERHGSTKDFFCCPYCSLKSVPLLFCGCFEPDCDRGAPDRFNDCGVELAQQLLWQTILSQLSQKVYPLLGLFEGAGYPLLVLEMIAARKSLRC